MTGTRARDPFDRAVLALGALAVLSPVFHLTQGSNTNFVLVRGAGLAVFVGIGLVALAGGLAGLRLPVVVAGAASGLAGVVQLAQFGRSTDWIDGNGSTATLLLGIGVGLLVLGLARPAPEGDRRVDPALTQG